ncbi:MAG TPA: hypothetical protein DD706_03160 [Nitrospiraceae bacterium]|nr:hypothetical protein [Nitrospiraceae bacterium]
MGYATERIYPPKFREDFIFITEEGKKLSRTILTYIKSIPYHQVSGEHGLSHLLCQGVLKIPLPYFLEK